MYYLTIEAKFKKNNRIENSIKHESKIKIYDDIDNEKREINGGSGI
jgi:hypothetical protein